MSVLWEAGVPGSLQISEKGSNFSKRRHLVDRWEFSSIGGSGRMSATQPTWHATAQVPPSVLLTRFPAGRSAVFSSTCLTCMLLAGADINECALGGHACHAGQDCDNTIGSYRCVVHCGIGFRRTSDGLNCQGRKMEVYSYVQGTENEFRS